jgi:hypothetical protein
MDFCASGCRAPPVRPELAHALKLRARQPGVERHHVVQPLHLAGLCGRARALVERFADQLKLLLLEPLGLLERKLHHVCGGAECPRDTGQAVELAWKSLY